MNESKTGSTKDSKMQPEERRERRQAYSQLVMRYLRPERKRVIWLGLMLFAGVGLQLYIPQLMRRFIDGALEGAEPSVLQGVALVFLALAVMRELINAGVTYLGQDLRWRSTNALRADLTRHCLRLNMGFHNGQTPGKMIERVDGDVTALSNLMSDYSLRVVANFIILLGVLVILGFEDLGLGIVFALFVGTTSYALRKLATIAVPAWKDSREASAELFGFLEERLAGTEDIRGAGAEAWVVRRFQDRNREFLQTRRKANLLGSSIWVGSVALFTVGNILALAMGGWLYGQGRITLGTVYLIFHYTEMMRGPIEQLSHQLEDLQRAGGGLERVNELLALRLRAEAEAPIALPAGPVGLEMDGITFGYQPEEPVLHGIDLNLAPGKVLGLLGRTGSGKTTLSRLLFRLYEVQEGSLKIGGVPIQQAALADLRRRVGLVTQDVQLFNASVRDNLSFFDDSIPDARILEVIYDIGLKDWFESLPDGLDSELETGSGGLSAGEAQLLAFTRVFLRDPGIVVLDEASSRLDPATEQRIERAVDRLLAGRTGIIIAHRLGTVQRCDEIMILSDGRIKEHGDRLDLMADSSSRFSELLRAGLEEVLA